MAGRISFSKALMLLTPIAIGLALVALLALWRSPPKQLAPREQAAVVRVLTLAPTDFLPRVHGYGTVAPERVWSAAPQVAGRVEYVHPNFKVGALVEAGTELVRISPSDYELAVRQAEANIRAGKARLEELKVQRLNTEQSLELERRSTKIKQDELARKTRLAERGAVSEASVDDVQRELLAQRAREQELQNSLRLLPTQITVQEEQIAVYEAELETARLNLERTKITVPFDARIAEANVEVAQFVGVGATLGSADAIDAAEVTAQIPVKRFRKFIELTLPQGFKPPTLTNDVLKTIFQKFGWTAKIRLDRTDDTDPWDARVVRTSDTINPDTRTVGVIVTVDKPYKLAVPGVKPPLVKGMFVEVELEGKPAPAQLVIPRAALHGGEVYVVDSDNRLEVRPVEVRYTQQDVALISTGLRAGDRVVLTDLSPAIPGMLLEVNNGSPATPGPTAKTETDATEAGQ